MISDTIYKGRGTSEENEKLVQMINAVFSPERDSGFDFYELLPKLYKHDYYPAQHNFIVREGEEIKGAVGLYYGTLTAGEGQLFCGGIGNVAVTRDCRSKGYMKDCMSLALRDMVEKGADIGFLGGQRQRYAYFSYEQGGQAYHFTYSMRNMQHVFGMKAESAFEIVPVKKDDSRLLDDIHALHGKKTYRFARKREDLYDILTSWENTPVAFTRNGEFKGYCILSDNGSYADDLTLLDPADSKDAALALLENNPGANISLNLPPCETALIRFFSDFAEHCSIHTAENMTVLNYQNALQVLLSYKARYSPLCDTDTKLLIHGFAGDENIRITVRNNHVSVTPCEGADLELDHLTAVRTLFGICPPNHEKLPVTFKAILPVPFFVAGADNV